MTLRTRYSELKNARSRKR